MVQDTSLCVCDIMLALNMPWPVTWPRSKILNLMLGYYAGLWIFARLANVVLKPIVVNHICARACCGRLICAVYTLWFGGECLCLYVY